jgi:prevent-host-death family protein
VLKKKQSTVRAVSASQFKQNFGEIMRRVYEDNEIVMIERSGVPVAFLTPVSDFALTHPEAFKALPAAATAAIQKQAVKRFNEFMDSRPESPYSEEEVERDVMKAVYEVRYGKQKKKK